VCATERVIDDEAPCSVWLPAQHIRGLAGHLYSFTVGSCTRKVPIGERKGQIVCFKDLPYLAGKHRLSPSSQEKKLLGKTQRLCGVALTALSFFFVLAYDVAG
jgi:hypothetical protein